MAIFEILPRKSDDHDSVSISELVEISDPSSLIKEAGLTAASNIDLRFRMTKLSDSLTANFLLQLAKYKLLKDQDSLANEIPAIARCKTESEFVTAFYGIGNTLERFGYDDHPGSGSDIEDIFNFVSTDALVSGAIKSLELRERVFKTNRTLGRFLIFNATAGVSLANFMYEHDQTAFVPSPGEVVLSNEAVPGITGNFRSYRSALDYVERFLDLGLTDGPVDRKPVLRLVSQAND